MKIYFSEMFYCKICYKRFYNVNYFFWYRVMNLIDCNCEGYVSNIKYGVFCVKVRVFFKVGNSYILDVCKESLLYVCKICLV